MDPSYLSQQVNTIIGQLHGLFDEIGVPNHDRDQREEELFAALSETLNNQVKLVTAEKKGMVDEAERLITAIRQMEASLDDAKAKRDQNGDDDNLGITFPLSRCLKVLKEKHTRISRLHRERYEQVRKLVEALESYSSHLEPSFVRIALPPTDPKQSIPPTFDISPTYVRRLDDEFSRVYEEYTRRVETVKALSENIIQLWAELGTPQAQTDGAIVKYYRDAPEQLGLHEEDLLRLKSKRDKLADEKKSREKRLKDLRIAVDALWEKLGVDELERKSFMSKNRGCGVRQINEYEDELGRLNELKRQNLHLFVEDARFKLQELWDALYFSEDEMLEFTPAFSDVYSDALLEAHERELSRLEALKEQRAPTLAFIEKYRELVKERDELTASSQDASRLMGRGQKGERRDPGKLLREEKMRKRITKELPKVAADLVKLLAQWEDEYGRPFLVHGERYLDVLQPEEPVLPPRSKTPAGGKPPVPTRANSTVSSRPEPPATLTRASSTIGRSEPPAPPTRANSTLSRAGTIGRSKTPTASLTSTVRKAASSQSVRGTLTGSPTRIPARAPLSNIFGGNNSPERARPESQAQGGSRPGHPFTRAPPPKMRELGLLGPLGPPIELETPVNPYRSVGLGSSSHVRAVEPEDVYDDRNTQQAYGRSYMTHASQSSTRSDRSGQSGYPRAPPPRQISNTSTNTSTVTSGSENWETYSDISEPEADASDAYYAKVRATTSRGKRYTPDDGYDGQVNPPDNQSKRIRGIPPAIRNGHINIDAEGNRIISGSEWPDGDAY